jgi:sorbose reductase
MSTKPSQSLGQDNYGAPQPSRVLPLFSMQGRTAIVTGAGAGIGLAIVEALAEAGANVAIFYHSNKSAITAAAKIEHTYGVQCKCRLGTLAVLEDIVRC